MRNRIVVMMMTLIMITGAGMLFAQAEAEQLPGIPSEIEQPSEINEVSGVVVTRVITDSAAQRAGILRGDVILSIAGNQVDSVADINDVLADYEHGQMIMIELERSGTRHEVDLQLETRVAWPLIGITGVGTDRPFEENRFGGPGFSGPGNMHQWDGPRMMHPGFMNPYMYGEQLPEDLIEAMESGDAAHIVAVENGSPADEGGLTSGSVIFAVDGKPLAQGDLATAVADLTPGQSVMLTVFDHSEITEITIILGDAEGSAYLGVRYIPVGAGMQFNRQEAPGAKPRGFGYQNLNDIDG